MILNISFQRFLIILFLALFVFSCSKEDVIDPGLEVTTSDIEFTIDESPEAGWEIGTVPGESNQGAVSFTIIDQSVPGAFAIESDSGKLIVSDPLAFNYRINPVITGRIKVSRASLFEIANVKITLNFLGVEKWHEGDVKLYTQSDIDAFGSAGYTHINGNLYIGNTSYYDDIQNTRLLLTLEGITGWIRIIDCSQLEVLDGLKNITEIGLGILIDSNPKLEKIDSFNKVSKLEYLHFQNNLNLKEIESFTQLSEVDYLLLSDLHLTDFNFLPFLKKVDGFSIYFAPNLKNLDAFSGLETVGRQIELYHIYKIENLDGLSNVTSTFQNLNISSNPKLLNINGLFNTNITGIVEIENNHKLEHIDGISQIQNLSSVTLKNNTSLRNLNGLANLVNITTNGLEIFNNNSLSDLNGLSSLQNIEGVLNIRGNISLRNFCSLQPALNNSTPSGFIISGNAFNPTRTNIINGICSN